MGKAALRHEPAAERGSRVVLVVENNALIRLSVADHLRDVGYSVLEASNGDEALAVLASPLPVEVVFTDVQMPGSIDGNELAHWTRENHPETRVILTSAQPKAFSREPLDDVPFIPKPYQPEEVAERVRAELEKGSDEAVAVSEALPVTPKRRPAAL
jgi:two-component system, response regulator PdtaR